MGTYTYNDLNEPVTGSWSGTLSTFGWTQTENLDHVQVATGQQSKVADVFQQGEFTAKQFDVPAGDNVFTVTRVANDCCKYRLFFLERLKDIYYFEGHTSLPLQA